MITPENNVPLDDAENEEADDQQSQKDIHSNGFDEDYDVSDEDDESDLDLLDQSYEASESSYTLNLDDDPDEDD